MLLLLMILKQLSERHQRPIHNEDFKTLPYKWIFFLLAVFLFWSVILTFRSEYFIISLFELWRFVSCFVIIAFLIRFLDSYDKFIKVLIFYCCVSAIYALSAVYATNFAFQVNYELFQIFDTFISFQISLFNQAAAFSSENVGMITGVGLTAKHDLALLLAGGIFFAFFLMNLYNSLKARSVLIILIFLFMTIIYQVFSRVSITGMFLVAVFLCLAIPSWRKLTVWVVVMLIVMNLAGLFFSSLIRTTHMKNMESTLQKVESVTSESEFEPSSLSGRKYIWKKVIEIILRNKGLGSGPGSLMTDVSFAVPHGHNLLLTLASEYGLPGAGLILIFLLVIANSAYKSGFFETEVDNKLLFMQAIFVAASLHALFVYCFDMPLGRKQFWFVLGLLMASISLAGKEAKKDNLPKYLSAVVY